MTTITTEKRNEIWDRYGEPEQFAKSLRRAPEAILLELWGELEEYRGASAETEAQDHQRAICAEIGERRVLDAYTLPLGINEEE